MNRMTIAARALAVATILSAPSAFADAGHGHGAAIGQPAKASAASRTL